jgi:predicted Zn-dependent protease
MSAAGLLASCATDPVTGQKVFNMYSEGWEVSVDKQHSPHQFSNDYGVTQNKTLNNYIASIGQRMAAKTHRPAMPYSFNTVNAVYVNAYTFPGGSMATTRGILLKLDSEAELASLLGHELGHVNARHAAESASKGIVAQALVVGGAIALGAAYDEDVGNLAGQLGMLGAGALLSSYSRDNEREADALGMEYMVRSEYNPDGMVGLMDMLKSLNKHKPSSVELLFATHPMSDERYDTTVKYANSQYASAKKYKLYRERYMDNIASLRAQKGAIEAMQKGEGAMGKKKYSEAENNFKTALKQEPNDYAGLLLMSKCMLAQNRDTDALKYAEKAKRINPNEAQARHIAGFASLKQNKFDRAHADFTAYQRLLPGNPMALFFKGYALEGMGQRQAAAQEYYGYLKQVNQGNQATYAYTRLKQWNYIK